MQQDTAPTHSDDSRLGVGPSPALLERFRANMDRIAKAQQAPQVPQTPATTAAPTP